jgi:hypothetical protein
MYRAGNCRLNPHHESRKKANRSRNEFGANLFNPPASFQAFSPHAVPSSEGPVKIKVLNKLCVFLQAGIGQTLAQGGGRGAALDKCAQLGALLTVSSISSFGCCCWSWISCGRLTALACASIETHFPMAETPANAEVTWHKRMFAEPVLPLLRALGGVLPVTWKPMVSLY